MISLLPEEIVLGWGKQLSVSINLCRLTFILPLFPVLTSYLFPCSLDSPLRMFFYRIKMLQTSNKNKILSVARGKKDITSRENKIRMTADVLLWTMQVKRPWSKSLKCSKKKKSIQNSKSSENISPNWRWNTFSDIQKVKGPTTSRTAPQEVLNSPSANGKWYRNAIWSYIKE